MASWIDKIKEIMTQRSIRVYSHQHRVFVITKNKSIMQFAQVHADKVVNDNTILEMINHVRLDKEVFLLVELVGASSREEIEAFKDGAKLS